ncbi:MAG: hypothetical protein IPI88_10820 [Chitinophagaceae bacterium]|nr:hypothetical protein [Chitinophagaceae bacterium]
MHTHVITGSAKMLTTSAAANAGGTGGTFFANDATPKYKNSGDGDTMKPATVALGLGTGELL